MITNRPVPVIAAPMAGGVSTPALAAAVSSAGGLGFLAAGYLSEQALRTQIEQTRELTDEPFGVNLFVPGARRDADLGPYQEAVEAEAARYGVRAGTPHWDDDDYQAKVELVIAERVPVVSFTFGAPSKSTVDRLHEVGAEVAVTVTTPQEARIAAEAGADVLCVQGSEAGGHRATFEDDERFSGGGPLYGLLAALRVISAEVDLPLVAAGGLVRGADVAAVLSAGAVAAQLGTAFLVCEEAGTQPTQREAIAAGARETELTRAFSGRPARGLVNRFLTEHRADAPAAYPQLHHLTKPVRGAAGKAGDPEAMSLWAGQTYAQARPMRAAGLVRVLVDEAREALDSVRRVL
ncbi:nitronate monooxygenase [Saccharopolyspora taberi]|uniref:Propionate 3-nitronate monooxygenase n=2 Tax=Saccharopolyspora taberi TaxID=60895 RepID=A0ABN3V315_9PSEU